MVILLDSSGSITRKQFRMEKKFASDLIKHFEISKEKTNVALAAFSQYTRTTRTFQNDVSEELVSKAIGKLRYEGAASRLDLGFDVVKFSLFNTENGARVTNKGTFCTLFRDHVKIYHNKFVYLHIYKIDNN